MTTTNFKKAYYDMEKQLKPLVRDYGDYSTLHWTVEMIYLKSTDTSEGAYNIDYNTETRDDLIDKFIDKIDNNRRTVNKNIKTPEYQRKFIWSDKMKSKFIESLLLGIPIPSIFLSKKNDNTYDIVDGFQRISSIIEFKDNKLCLKDLTILTSFNGKNYEDLSDSIKKQLDETLIIITLLKQQKNISEVFNRINSTGEKLSDAELRFAVYGKGKFYKLVIKLIEIKDFQEICPVSQERQDRKEYEELIIRFFAYFDEYKDFKHDVNKFLDDYTKRKNLEFASDNQLSKIYEERFMQVMSFIKNHFGTIAKKTKKNNAKSTPRVRFEALTVGSALAIKENPRIMVAAHVIRLLS